MDAVLIQGDCIAEMSKMESQSVNLVITSPPYNLAVEYATYKDKMSMGDYLEWTNKWLAQVHRLLKPDGSLFLNVGGSPSQPWIPIDVAGVARSLGYVLQNRIAWVKSIHADGHTHGHVKPIQSPRYLNGTHEFIFHFTKMGNVEIQRYVEGVGVPFAHPSNLTRWGHDRVNACGGNTWHIPYETVQSKTERGNHPATFPVELPRRCLKLAGAQTDWVVLDPFCGIGSTATACQELGLKSISIDVDQSYIETATARLKCPPSRPRDQAVS